MKDERVSITKEALVRLINMAYMSGWDSAWKTLEMIRDTAGLSDEQMAEVMEMLASDDH